MLRIWSKIIHNSDSLLLLFPVFLNYCAFPFSMLVSVALIRPTFELTKRQMKIIAFTYLCSFWNSLTHPSHCAQTSRSAQTSRRRCHPWPRLCHLPSRDPRCYAFAESRRNAKVTPASRPSNDSHELFVWCAESKWIALIRESRQPKCWYKTFKNRWEKYREGD